MTGLRTAPRPKPKQVRGAAKSARRLGRLGLVGRAVFYALLAYLAARLAAVGNVHYQPDAAGALSLLTRSPVGEVAVGVAAAGFLSFGGVRLHGALTDHSVSRWRRTTTALQGAFYLALAYVPISFLVGRHSTGSEQSQHAQTATLLRLPGGAVVVVGIGVVILAVCGWQIRTAATQDYADGMDEPRNPALRLAIRLAGTVGIAARAAVFGPIGAFFIAAGVSGRVGESHGLDGELLRLAGQWWGRPVLALVAAGLIVFTGYSLLEARYRDIDSGR